LNILSPFEDNRYRVACAKPTGWPLNLNDAGYFATHHDVVRSG
jgi:hypothetical protein